MSNSTSTTNFVSATNYTEEKKVALYFTVDFINGKICGKEINFKYAGVPGTSQYKELVALQAAHPGFGLNPIKPKKVKQTYAGLNRDLMREYILIQEAHEVVLAKFEEQINDGVSFPTIKSWFLDQFKGFNVKKAEKMIRENRLANTKKMYAVKVVARGASNSPLSVAKVVNHN